MTTGLKQMLVHVLDWGPAMKVLVLLQDVGINSEEPR